MSQMPHSPRRRPRAGPWRREVRPTAIFSHGDPWGARQANGGLGQGGSQPAEYQITLSKRTSSGLSACRWLRGEPVILARVPPGSRCSWPTNTLSGRVVAQRSRLASRCSLRQNPAAVHSRTRAPMRLGSDLHGPRIGIRSSAGEACEGRATWRCATGGSGAGSRGRPFPARAMAHAGAIVGAPEVARRVAEIQERLLCRHPREPVGPAAVRRHWIHPEVIGHHGHQEWASLGRVHLVLRRASTAGGPLD
jgi:hypothetical protein